MISFITDEYLFLLRGKVIRGKFAIFCGGLYADKLADLIDGFPDPRIVPFRGEYLELKEDRRFLVRGNIYPVCTSIIHFLLTVQ